jgi:hypothetical protein
VTRVERNDDALCLYTSNGEILLFLRHEIDDDFYRTFCGGRIIAAAIPSGYPYHNQYSYTALFRDGKRIYPVNHVPSVQDDA